MGACTPGRYSRRPEPLVRTIWTYVWSGNIYLIKGNRRTVEYQVSRIAAEPPAPPTVPAVGQQGRQVVPVAVQTTTPVSRGREAAVDQLRRALEVSIDGLVAARDYGKASGLEMPEQEGVDWVAPHERVEQANHLLWLPYEGPLDSGDEDLSVEAL